MSFGPTAVVRVEGIDILVVSVRCQIFDGEQFRAFGIAPEKKRVVVLKSMDHFRADFTPVAGRIVTCDSGALCSPNYRNYPFKWVRRPIHPLDAVESPKFA
jgi:microcystin degradation protein MlrC